MLPISDVLFLSAGFFLGLSFQGGMWFFLIPFALVALVFGWLNRPRFPVPPQSTRGTAKNDATAVGMILRKAVPPITKPQLRTTFEREAAEFNEPTSKMKIDQLWTTVESELDASLRFGLQALKSLLPNAHSVLLFFEGKAPGTLVLRQFISDEPDSVTPHVHISENSSLINSLMRAEVSRILEGDLHGGKALCYYNGNPQIRSLAGVPVFNRNQAKQGVLVVDSLTPNAFDNSVVTALTALSKTLYMLCFKSYASAKNYMEQQQFSILYNNQRNFFQNMTVKDIYKQIFEYVKSYIPYDRLMILAVENAAEGRGRVVWCDGVDHDEMLHHEFTLSDKGVVILSLIRNYPIERNFSGNPNDYLLRINEKEKKNAHLRYLFAMPVATEPGAESADITICLESYQPSRFSNHEKDLLKAIAGVAGFAFDRARQFEAGRDLAAKDGLTGLINHRTMHERLRTEKLRADRQKIGIGILMMDIDHFKKVNDTYGHSAGDEVIKGIARTISQEVRGEIDIVARYGGEEFVVALVDVSPEGLKETAERIRRAVEAKPFDIHRAEPLAVTVSIGSFLVKPEFRDMKQAIHFADKALYKAKAEGRNRVVEYIGYDGEKETTASEF
ncbi:MAG: GGDEF domain-containing protein [Fibrobacter sp.]|jgi:diguanylate cyclase (GGDEF)-like protein|nr:GGDEF domain-containing protein [Fibrobacter sp.]